MSHPLDRVRCVLGDITAQEVDAVVNAANAALRGGGGVDGAIHRAAGEGLLAELVRRYPDGCGTGEVRVTDGHGLAARMILHAVGPVWRGGRAREDAALESCWTRSLTLADENGARTIAFPAISCGVYRFPPERAAAIAARALARGLPETGLEEVRIVLFSDELLAVFRRAVQGARDVD